MTTSMARVPDNDDLLGYTHKLSVSFKFKYFTA
jgi:hypothetical protein